jgi:hypothetical protein
MVAAPNTNGMLEVSPPIAEDVEAAKLRVSEAFQSPVAIGSKRGGEGPLLSAES